jgi:MSHA biogenesis protein MshL
MAPSTTWCSTRGHGSHHLEAQECHRVEVLDAVRDAYGYDYRRMSSGFVIVPPSLQTRLYQLNYIDLERRGTSRMRVQSGQSVRARIPAE